MIQNIIKRDETVTPFEKEKIVNAIKKAFNAVDIELSDSLLQRVTETIMDVLDSEYDGVSISPTVEHVQDIVENALMKHDCFDVAKAYIVYRQNREMVRLEKQEELKSLFEKKTLMVIKFDGKKQKFNVDKFRKVFDRAAVGYKKSCTFESFVEAFKKNLVPEMKSDDINRLMVKTSIDLVSTTNIAWQHVAARIFLSNLYKRAIRNRNIKIQDIYKPETYARLFDSYIEEGLYYKDFYTSYSKEDILKAGAKLNIKTDDSYEYTTVLSFAKRYLLNPNGIIRELPQEMYMSVALFLAIPEKDEDRLEYAFKLYEFISKQYISLPTPTLLNGRTNYHQLSSCFKLNVDDDLRAIYHAVENMAQISKFGGGVGVYLGNIRPRGSTLRGVHGVSGGVNPWIKVINDTATAVNQLGSRIGAISVTLDMWHLDIYDFLDLQTETGDIRSKSFDIFPAISVPDIFMRRVREDTNWTLFDVHEIEIVYGKKLQDHFGKDFDEFYEELEKDEKIIHKKIVKAKDLFVKHLRVVVETGMPYVFFRDTVNRANPNKHAGNIYSSQLCTEICQNTSPTKFAEEVIENEKIAIKYEPGDTVVCNLASINMAKVHDEKTISEVFPIMMRALDNVISLNFYPIKESERTAFRYRSIGIGYLGLAEYLATNHFDYASEKARKEVNRLFEMYAFHTYSVSVALAQERGAYPLFNGSEYSKGSVLGHNKSWFEKNTPHGKKWGELLDTMKKTGVRFAYHTAPAPNTSTAGVVGTTAALMPIYKRYFVETNLSAPTVRVAPKLAPDNHFFYKEYASMNMNDVIDMIATIHPWVDQSISFEWMVDPARTAPKDLFEYYFRAWQKKIKTVYYVRSLSADVSTVNNEDKNVCESCSG